MIVYNWLIYLIIGGLSDLHMIRALIQNSLTIHE